MRKRLLFSLTLLVLCGHAFAQGPSPFAQDDDDIRYLKMKKAAHISSFSPIALCSVSCHTYVINSISGTTPGINTTGSTLLTAVIGTYNANSCTGVTIVDSNSGNNWVCVQNYASSPAGVAIWHADNPTVGAGETFTVTGAYFFAGFAGWSNVLASSPLDVQNGGTAEVPEETQNTGSVTPTANNELCFAGGSGFLDAETSVTLVSPSQTFTLLDSANSDGGNNVGGADGYFVQTTAGAISTTYTSNGSAADMAAAIACFKHS